MSIYRTIDRKCSIIERPGDQEWVSKKFLFLPLWVAVILLIMVAIGVGGLLLVFGIPIGDASGDAIAVVEGIGVTAVSVSAAAAIRLTITVVRNIIVTQKSQLERQMNQTALSAQLGFMSCVKSEVRTITGFLQYMEIFQRRKLRVVLEITHLDTCSPDKVVGVLDAMNILLSDDDAPFISILAVDSSIIVDCVESSKYMRGMANNGYEFLNRIVTLPFSVPRMDCDTKRRLIRNIIARKEQLEAEVGFRQDGKMEASSDFLNISRYHSANHDAKNPLAEDSQIPLMVGTPALGTGSCGKGIRAKDLIQDAFDYLLDDALKEFMTDNVVQMRRIVNTVTITIRLLASNIPKDEVCPKKVVEWVLLANQWPCRLSWLLQCIEDQEQRSRMGSCHGSPLRPDMSLWEVYEKYMEELDMLKGQMEKLLELDQDPELFHTFLCGRFRVEEALFYLPFTVNLDPSLKRQMELQRGSHRLKRTKKFDKLSACTLLGMTVEDVCREMDTIGLKEENVPLYKQRLRDHNLNGRALVYSDNTEIKEALHMSLGEWTLFSIHFLGVFPPANLASSVVSPVPFHVRPEALKNMVALRETVARGSKLSLNSSREDLWEKR